MGIFKRLQQSRGTMAQWQAPTVVRMRRQRGKVIQDCDIYIGREQRLGGWDLDKSKWHNPFSIRKYGSREAVIAKFREYIMQQPQLLADLDELNGKRLGCWCKP